MKRWQDVMQPKISIKPHWHNHSMQESLLKQSSVAEPISVWVSSATWEEWIHKAKQLMLWTWCLSAFQEVLLWPSSNLPVWTEHPWEAGVPQALPWNASLAALGGTWLVQSDLTPFHDVNKGTASGVNWETSFKSAPLLQTKMLL